jgi:DNA-binding transcriptional regulator PaaX
MSIVDEIIKVVGKYPGPYGTIYHLLYDSQKQKTSLREDTVRNTLSRLKKKGLISNQNNKWSLTTEGKEFLLERKSAIKRIFPKKGIVTRPKTMIVIFDIPEKERKYRDWLRIELIGFGFEQVQKSVWFGPALPKEFILYLSERNILKYIRFFKATAKDLIRF